ncbi:MAG: bifunctional [glutamate--ammonia ligase]-adenylyl-L-tyrosine phosphorylase/[glutamate--ammonia-ligase] adenylyltransferase [Pseudomonadota bacterium]
MAESENSTATWLALGRERATELCGTAEAPHALARVLASSDFVYRELGRSPGLLSECLNGDRLTRCHARADYDAMVAEVMSADHEEADLKRELRWLRRREMARIAWRDIAELGDFETIAVETSALADALVDATLARAEADVEQRFGQALTPSGERQRMVVFALGKLGASELNFSSDIDLIFAFELNGETDGARTTHFEDFYPRVARRLMNYLGEAGPEGVVYRVDMRLRPFGTAGAMVASFAQMEDYYQTHGRDWERYAWIRARPVAGDVPAGFRLIEMLRPFIYRRYLDFGALESLREMKSLINAEVRRGGLEHNVKIGPGGIREVEFIAQAFQLVRGGRQPELRGRLVPQVLARLADLELLPTFAARGLARTYAFLRTLEHRLQQIDDRQVHTLPSEPSARARIAVSMHAEDWAALQRQLDRHRELVRAHFDQVFGRDDDEDVEARISPLAVLMQPDVESTTGTELLVGAGFGDDAPRAFEIVRHLLGNLHVRSLGERPKQWLGRLLPQLIEAAGGTGQPLVTLERLNDVMTAIAPRSTYLALLVERPLAMSQLVQLTAASPLIAHHIRRYPLVIDELLDTRTLYSPLRKAALETELRSRLTADDAGDLEQEMETLRREKQTNVLRVAAADVANALPLMQVSDHLTEIAEVCLDEALRITSRDLQAGLGVPRCTVDGRRRDAGVAVIGYGKLGGIELGYGSDLDLVYIHNSRGEQRVTSGPREVDNQLYFARLAQRLGHVITTRTPGGVLYEVDVRLRPNGNSGLPVIGIDGFLDYQRNEAWTWEHQALVRARFICGDPAIGTEFAEVRRQVLLTERDPDALRDEVRTMRARMLSHHGNRDPSRFDLKQDRGGIADIEFIVQYLVLRSARALGDHLKYTDNIRLLEGMAASGLMAAEDAKALAETYQVFRARGHALALQEEDSVTGAAEFADLRDNVARIWTEMMGTDSA